MKLNSIISKSFTKHSELPNCNFDTASRSISPISQNDYKNQAKLQYVNYKTCSSNSRSRNITPPEITHNTVNTLSSRRDYTPGACSNCHQLEKQLKIHQRTINKLKEVQVLDEKHMKQYESLLKIKENRLRERENSINEQIKHLETQYQKMSLDKSYSIPNGEKNTQSTNRSSSQTLWPKGSDFQALDKKLEIPAKKSKSTETKGLSLGQEIKKLEQLISIIKIKEENLANKEKELEKQKFLVTEKMKNTENLEKEVKSTFESLTKREKILENQENKLKEDLAAIKEKEKYLEEEVTILKTQKEYFEQESRKLQESYESRAKGFESLKTLSESRLSTENLQKLSPEKNLEVFKDQFDDLSFGRMEYTDSDKNSGKLSLVESFKESEQNSVFNDRSILSRDPFVFVGEIGNHNKSTYISRDSRDEYSNFSIIEKIKGRFEQKSLEHQHQLKLKDLFFTQEIEKLQSQIQDLQASISKLIEENRELVSLNENLQGKLGNLSEKTKILEKEKGFDKLDEVLELMQGKLKCLIEKEAELRRIESRLKSEQEIVGNEAQCLKVLYEDLSEGNDRLSLEKQDFFVQKSAVLEVERKQKEMIELVRMKESELFRLKDELVKKEKILKIKFRQAPGTMFKRGNSQREDSIDDSLIIRR